MDSLPPSVPAEVATTSPACGSIRISWSPSQDLGGSGLKGYNVYRKGVFVRQVSAPSTSFTDSGLPSAAYYYYTVSSIDNAGNESAKTSAVGTYGLSCAGSGGEYGWSKHVGGDILPDEGLAVAVDSAGHSYVTGDFSVTANFGGTTLVSAGTRDAFVAKYRADGTLVWAKRLGGAYDDFGQAVAVDGAGNVLVTGKFQAAGDFAGSSLISAGGYDIFLAKLAGLDGRPMWVKRIGGSGSDEGASLALDGSGNAYLAGQFQGAVDFGSGPVANTNPYAHAFVAKYSGADGSAVWSRRFGKLNAYTPITSGSARSISVDGSGNVALAGYFSGPVDFGLGALTSAGGADVFVARLAGSDGRTLWARRFGDGSDQRATAVGTDTAGNVVVAGDFLGTIDFGSGALGSTPGAQTIFLAKLYADGLSMWSRSFVATGVNGGSYAWALASDSAGNVVVTGQMSGPVDLGGGALANVGGVFVSRYSASGAHLWSKNFRGGGGAGRGIAVGAGGAIVVTGAFDTVQDFGGGELRSNGNTGDDLFILSLLP